MNTLVQVGMSASSVLLSTCGLTGSLSFFRVPMTCSLVMQLTNLTSNARGGSGSASPSLAASLAVGSLGWPTRWEMAISSRSRAGSSLRRLLNSLNTLSSVLQGSSSGIPKIRTESRRPCCSRSSTLVCSSVTSLWRERMLSSLVLSSPLSCVTVCVWELMASVIFLVTGSRWHLSCCSNIRENLCTTSCCSRADRSDSVNSPWPISVLFERSRPLLVSIGSTIVE